MRVGVVRKVVNLHVDPKVLIAMKNLLEQEAVEPACFRIGDEAGALQQVGSADREAQGLVVALVEPIEPKLVHVGHDPPRRENRVCRKESATCVAQVIQTLANG